MTIDHLTTKGIFILIALIGLISYLMGSALGTLLVGTYGPPDRLGIEVTTSTIEGTIQVDITPIEESPVWVLDEEGWVCVPGSPEAELAGVCDDAESPGL